MSLRRTRVVVAVLGVSLVAGCSAGSTKDDQTGSAPTTSGSGAPGSSAPSGPSNDGITIGLIAEPASLDFTKNDGAAIPQAELGNIYETLVKQDQNGKVVNGLATKRSVEKDRKTYTFDLPANATFSNGTPLTADDVVYSINQVKTKWTIGLKAKMDPVASVKALSPTKVQVLLKQPSNNWLFDMTTRIGAIFPKAGGDLANKPIGSGPYTFTKWARGDSIVLTRNEKYWGTKPHFKTVTLKYFKDPTSLNNALLSKTINVVSTVQAPESLSQFSPDKYQIIEGTTNGEIVLSMNNARAPFNDKRVRQAVRYGINHKGLIDTCWAGHGEQIGSMVPPTDPWYEDLTKVTPYDQQKAKDLLKQSGKAGTTIRLRLPALPYATACGPVVKSMLEQVGFKVKLDTLEFPAAWLSNVFTNADYDMSMISHVEPRDLPTVFGDPKYYTKFSDPQMQTYLKAADSGTETDQVANMKKAARLLVDDAAADFLFLLPNLMVADKGITGLPKNAITEGFDLAALSR
ncbi:ABC transporter substrate-binding protein [Luteipulveratus mongoliensis]|uniref:Peptide ABC transporter substrate-binding protein n=1 Tax=Luteipulveratus mongoliensis TaxID=571913 RepID=A0A0K1JP39_9MICO|nr:ABC transporter substrate-binding protein [Luteipulveratus mongoliensis]AKU18335.1 peptide ABC transporter substrate-binding protein [Luteipulveratus mongoliensis]